MDIPTQKTLIECAQTLAEQNPSISPNYYENDKQLHTLVEKGYLYLIESLYNSNDSEYRITQKGKGQLAGIIVRQGKKLRLSIKEVREL